VPTPIGTTLPAPHWSHWSRDPAREGTGAGAGFPSCRPLSRSAGSRGSAFMVQVGAVFCADQAAQLQSVRSPVKPLLRRRGADAGAEAFCGRAGRLAHWGVVGLAASELRTLIYKHRTLPWRSLSLRIGSSQKLPRLGIVPVCTRAQQKHLHAPLPPRPPRLWQRFCRPSRTRAALSAVSLKSATSPQISRPYLGAAVADCIASSTSSRKSCCRPITGPGRATRSQPADGSLHFAK